MTVAGLVLAAGAGRRLGRPKALVEVKGRRLVDRAVEVLRDGRCDPVYVVSGAAPLEVPGAVVVHNAQWPTGMGSTLRCGLDALAECDAQGAVVMVVDTPGIGADAVRRLVDACVSDADLVVATYDGRRRNPVLLGRAHWPGAAAAAVGDVGARAYLAAQGDAVTEVECADIADPRDLDTPEDFGGGLRLQE